MEKIRPSASGQASDILGNIMSKGENDADDAINYTNVQFRSKVVGAGSERGSIEFVTKGAVGADVANEILLDINETTANTVTVHDNFSVEGSMSLNGAAFKDDITSDGKGENSLGTMGSGEWKSLHLYDAGAGASDNARITFGSGTDDTPVAGDIQLKHDPTNSGLTLNDDHRFQFRDAATYVASSASNVLDLVAPTLVASQSGTAAGTVYIGTGGANKVEAADATSMTVTSPILVLNGSTRTSVQAELQLKDQLVFNDAADELSIAETGTDDYTIKNLTEDKDIIVNVNVGSSDTEVARFVGYTGSLQMTDEQKLELDIATNYINSTNSGAELNVKSDGELAIDVGSITMTNGSGDFAMTVTKDLASEVLKSSVASKPVWTIQNTGAATQAGAILEFKKDATQAGKTMGTLRSSLGADQFAAIEFKSKAASSDKQGSIVFTNTNADGGGTDAAFQIMDIGETNLNTVTIGTDGNAANLKVWGTLTATSTSYENDILPSTAGGASLGADATEWANVYLDDDSKIRFGSGDPGAQPDVELSHINTGDKGLLLSAKNKFYFDDASNKDQFIGSKTGGDCLTLLSLIVLNVSN